MWLKSQKSHDDTQCARHSFKFTHQESVKKTQIHKGPQALKERKRAQQKSQEYSHPEVQTLPHTPSSLHTCHHRILRSVGAYSASAYTLYICLAQMPFPLTPETILEIFAVTD